MFQICFLFLDGIAHMNMKLLHSITIGLGVSSTYTPYQDIPHSLESRYNNAMMQMDIKYFCWK